MWRSTAASSTVIESPPLRGCSGTSRLSSSRCALRFSLYILLQEAVEADRDLLGRKRSEDQTEDANHDVRAGAAEEPVNSLRRQQCDERQQQNKNQNTRSDGLLPNRLAVVVRQKNDGHDRTGVGDARECQRKHGDVMTRLRVRGVFHHAGTKHHLQAEEKQNDAAGDLKRHQTDA